MHVFGSSGVRGVALEELTPAYALEVAQAAGTVVRDRTNRVAVGRDTRVTGELFADAVGSGLASVGVDVDRVGIVPTPALQAYCESERIPGVMVTASHNPPEFNGIKLCGADGVELTRETLDEVERVLEAGPSLVAWDESGAVRNVDSVNRAYREQLLARVDRERIAGAELRVALDPGHGPGAITSPELLGDLGCHVTTVNAQLDGTFPGRDPEPVADTLADLGELVRAADADIGIAHDGDGDRAMFFDETGSLVDGGAALAALAAEELSAGDTVVSAVNASQRLVDVVEQAGAQLHLTPIGSTHIITAIRRLQSAGEPIPIAGENNGGIIFPNYRLARDGAYTAARFCELAATESVSELVAPYDDYENVRYDLAYRDKQERDAMLDAIERATRDASAEVDETDGYRLDYGDAWVLARPSGTEPVVRVYAEAGGRDRAERLADQLVETIEDGC
jgi:phosphomannomutase/phosphoglucomutase